MKFIQSHKRRTNAMTRCRIPEFCKRYKIDVEIHDFRGKRILLRSVKHRDIGSYIQKNQYCVLWKKIRSDSLLNGVNETEAIFDCVNNKINEDNLSQRVQ